MKLPALRLDAWRQDRLLGRVVRNSGYLLASNVVSAVLSILAARLLGSALFGALGAITDFASNANRLFSFRMGDLVVKYAGEYQVSGENAKAGALIKAAGLAEALSSVLAFALVILLAPLGAALFAKDVGMASLIRLYAFSLLAGITVETSTAVLQVGNHYRSQAALNLAQSIITALIIVYAYVTRQGILVVVLAYLVGKIILGLTPMLLSLYWLPRMFGRGWWRAPFSILPPRRELVRYAVSTNLHGTVTMLGRDSEILWINLFLSTTVGGYYKVARALINVLVTPIQPFIATTFPEITRTIAARHWPQLRSLLGRVSAIAAAWTVAVAAGLLALGRPVLFSSWTILGRSISIYTPEYLPALPVLFILVAGYAFPNILFWNRSVLLAFGLPDYALKVTVWTTLVKVALTVLLVPRLGYLTEAFIFAAYLAANALLLWQRGRKEIRLGESAGGRVGEAAA
jgi:O-antigen/teichoic acid export membrane protein